jgi:predicted nucleotidyltransferase
LSTTFSIPSSDPVLLEKAIRIAQEFARGLISEDITGIVFLGAVARGYFDSEADIDIAIFKREDSKIPVNAKFYKVEGMEVQVWLSDYERELTETWDMPKRWTYSQGQIFHDPQGKIACLLRDKVPLKAEEKRWMLMSGLTLSEWYVNRLTRLWVMRGNITAAHTMFSQGLIYFFDMLFALNDELVPDMKWRQYCVERLERLPQNFQSCLQQTMLLHAFSLEELERRRMAFMEMWEEMKPVIESEVGLSYPEIRELV